MTINLIDFYNEEWKLVNLSYKLFQLKHCLPVIPCLNLPCFFFPRDPMELMLMEQQLLRSPLRLYAGAEEEAEKRAAWARTPPALQLLALGGRGWPAAWPQPLSLPPDLWMQKPPTPLRYCPYPPPAHAAPSARPEHAPSPRHPLWIERHSKKTFC